MTDPIVELKVALDYIESAAAADELTEMQARYLRGAVIRRIRHVIDDVEFKREYGFEDDG